MKLWIFMAAMVAAPTLYAESYTFGPGPIEVVEGTKIINYSITRNDPGGNSPIWHIGVWENSFHAGRDPHSATGNEDFAANQAATPYQWPPNVGGTLHIDVKVFDDNIPECDETFRVSVAAGQNVNNADFPNPASYTVTIRDNDRRPGDVNGDGSINHLDMSIITDNLGKSPKNFFEGDLNCDGIVDMADCDILLAMYDAVPGDANSDGVFNSADLVLMFQKGYYEEQNCPGTRTLIDGDFNGDGCVNSRDIVFVFQSGTYQN